MSSWFKTWSIIVPYKIKNTNPLRLNSFIFIFYLGFFEFGGNVTTYKKIIIFAKLNKYRNILLFFLVFSSGFGSWAVPGKPGCLNTKTYSGSAADSFILK